MQALHFETRLLRAIKASKQKRNPLCVALCPRQGAGSRMTGMDAPFRNLRAYSRSGSISNACSCAL